MLTALFFFLTYCGILELSLLAFFLEMRYKAADLGYRGKAAFAVKVGGADKFGNVTIFITPSACRRFTIGTTPTKIADTEPYCSHKLQTIRVWNIFFLLQLS